MRDEPKPEAMLEEFLWRLGVLPDLVCSAQMFFYWNWGGGGGVFGIPDLRFGLARMFGNPLGMTLQFPFCEVLEAIG